MMELLNEFLSGSVAWGVLLTLAAFALGALVNRVTGKAFFNPLLLGAIFVIVFLSVCGIPYADYKVSAAPVNRGYQLTEELNIPLIIMEPIKGGTLANLPPEAEAPLKALRPEASDASWALRWVGSHRNVHVILSGMSAEDQLTDNLATFARFEPLTAVETAAVAQTAAFLHSRIKIGCTGCRYCMPCPMGVDIPDNFSIWNKLGMFGQPEAIKHQWEAHFPDAEKASHCVRCGKCEAACPQHLSIRNALAQLQQELDQL